MFLRDSDQTKYTVQTEQKKTWLVKCRHRVDNKETRRQPCYNGIIMLFCFFSYISLRFVVV